MRFTEKDLNDMSLSRLQMEVTGGRSAEHLTFISNPAPALLAATTPAPAAATPAPAAATPAASAVPLFAAATPAASAVPLFAAATSAVTQQPI